MNQRICSEEAVKVAEAMAKTASVRLLPSAEVDSESHVVPAVSSGQRKAPPRVRKVPAQKDQVNAITPELEGPRRRLREAVGTLSDEFVDVIFGKLIEALCPGLYDRLDEATLN